MADAEPTGGPGLFSKTGPVRSKEEELVEQEEALRLAGGVPPTVTLLGLITRIQAIEGQLASERLTGDRLETFASQAQAELEVQIQISQMMGAKAREGVAALEQLRAEFSGDFNDVAFVGARRALAILEEIVSMAG